MQAPTQITKPSAARRLWRRILNHWEFYLLLIPMFVIIFVFKYIPMYGVQIAFKNFKASMGIMGSPWVDPLFKHFTKFFNSYNFDRLVLNTFLLSFETLIFSFPLPIVLALMLNQVPNKKFQRTVQTVVYAPHFISVMVLAGMLHIFLSPYGGLVNLVINMFGGESIYFLGASKWFRPVYIISGIWQDTGWGTIIYLATLSGVNVELYEAATVDGASKWQQFRNVTLPQLKPTTFFASIMLIISCFKIYDVVAIMTEGGPGRSTKMLVTYIYDVAFAKIKYGQASAIAMVLLAIVLTITIIQFSSEKKFAND